MLRNEEFDRFPERITKEPVEVRIAKAKDFKSSPGLLEVLSKDAFWFVRDHVASNINTPKHCLEKLAKDFDFRVRSEAQKTLAKLISKNIGLEEDLESKISFAKNIGSNNSKSICTHIHHTRQ